MNKFEIVVASMAPVYTTLCVSAKNIEDAKSEALDTVLNGECRWAINPDNPVGSDVHIVSAEVV